MVRITTVSPDLLVKRSGRRSPEADVQIAQFRELLSALRTPSDAFLIELDPSDKPITVRARFLRTARSMGTEVVIRKHPKGFVVGLMTPERRTRQGTYKRAPRSITGVTLKIGRSRDARGLEQTVDAIEHGRTARLGWSSHADH